MGRAISPVFTVTRIYPSKFSTVPIRLGGGYLSAWDNSPGGTYRSGTGWEAGVGYDVRRGGGHHITPFVLYTGGRTDDLDVRAVTFRAGYTWR